MKLFLNEDIHIRVAKALRQRGIDAVTTQEAGQRSASDERQLAYAVKEGRILVSFNVGDFARIHAQWMRKGKRHIGIVVSEQLPPGELIRRLLRWHGSVAKAGMKNQLVFLSQWK